jgi:hypothetical protein
MRRLVYNGDDVLVPGIKSCRCVSDLLDILEWIPYKYENVSIETIPYSLT